MASCLSGDNVWIALQRGDILKIDRNAALERTVPTPTGAPVRSIFSAPDGTVYAMVSGEGVYRINSDNGITSLYIDSRQRLWIGMFDGIGCYDLRRGKMMHIDQSPFYSRSGVFAVRETLDGKLLMGTEKGLIIFNPTSLSAEAILSEADGLSDIDVRSIEIDSKGIAWNGTMHGITRYDPATGDMISITGGHGMSETSFFSGSDTGSSGQILFGGNQGYTYLDPAAMQNLDFKPPICVTDAYVNNQPVKMSECVTAEGDSLTAGGLSELNLSYADKMLMLCLSTMDYRDPQSVCFEWKMEGDKKWVRLKPGESTLFVPDMNPGTKHLQIRAWDNGKYSQITNLTINISSPWYLTTFAKIIYLLICIGLLLLIYTVLRQRSAREINEAKVRFFMDISHEIRSPITCLISPLESLIKQEKNPDRAATLRGMRRNASRVLSLANQLLEIRKIDKGKKHLHMQPTEMTGFTREIIEQFRNMAEQKSIEITLDAPETVDNVWIDRNDFDKVLVNLITNAIKYPGEGGKINVSLRENRDSGMFELRVEDTGTGIDPKHIEHIFERFYQASRTNAGFGVGLNLTWQLVLLHHGTISVQNRSDGVHGSIFTVRIPLGNEHLTEAELAPLSETPSYKPEDRRNILQTPVGEPEETLPGHHNSIGISLLIADDDAELLEFLRLHYSRGYRVFTATDGIQAQQILQDQKIDLIITDVKMPQKDGLELLKAVKMNVLTSHIPVILLSSRSAVADRMAGWSQGADAYIGKPFDIEELDTLTTTLLENRMRLRGKFSGAQDAVAEMESPEVKGNNDKLMERILLTINGKIADPDLNVEQLGAEIGISRAHLHRKMKEITGMTPSEFIRNSRIRRACEILSNVDVDITQVAYMVGFSSQPHFSTVFKRFTGYTPSEYRQRIISHEPTDPPQQ